MYNIGSMYNEWLEDVYAAALDSIGKVKSYTAASDSIAKVKSGIGEKNVNRFYVNSAKRYNVAVRLE